MPIDCRCATLSALWDLLKQSWDLNWKKRPTVEEFRNKLQEAAYEGVNFHPTLEHLIQQNPLADLTGQMTLNPGIPVSFGGFASIQKGTWQGKIVGFLFSTVSFTSQHLLLYKQLVDYLHCTHGLMAYQGCRQDIKA
jgi:hypothetical protein